MTIDSQALREQYRAGADGAVLDRAVSKTAWRLLPILTLAFIFNYIDRTSVGFAALTMNKDLGLSASQFGWGAGILFAGYCIFELPGNMALYRFGARKWLARIMFTWGLAAAATALATGPHSFYVVRFVLGVAEAGFLPGVTFFLACWFPAKYRARMIAWFMIAVPVSSVLSGPLSGALLKLDGILGLAGWKWMFILEGLPASLLGLLLLLVLRDSPVEAHWLKPEERSVLTETLSSEQSAKSRGGLIEALKDSRLYLLILIAFGYNAGSYGVTIWLPTILKSHGLSLAGVSLISAIPYIVATLAMLFWAYGADRTGARIFHLGLTCLLGVAGMVCAAFFDSLVPALIGITMAVVSTTTARALFWSVPTGFFSGAAAAGSLAFINSVGMIGGMTGPVMMGWVKEQTGSFILGMLGMAALLLLSALLTFTLLIFADQRES